MIIPCKDCLILPICKSKVHISCSMIWTWLYKDNEAMKDIKYKEFKEMRKYLKNCFTMQRGQ